MNTAAAAKLYDLLLIACEKCPSMIYFLVEPCFKYHSFQFFSFPFSIWYHGNMWCDKWCFLLVRYFYVNTLWDTVVLEMLFFPKWNGLIFVHMQFSCILKYTNDQKKKRTSCKIWWQHYQFAKELNEHMKSNRHCWWLLIFCNDHTM